MSSALGAVSKLVSGQTLPFELGDEVSSFAGKSPWRLHAGKFTRAGGSSVEDVSIFIFRIKEGSPNHATLARSAMKRMRTMKHPYLIPTIDCGELADAGIIYAITEPVTPLEDVLDQLRDPRRHPGLP